MRISRIVTLAALLLPTSLFAGLPQPPRANANLDSVCVGSSIIDNNVMEKDCYFATNLTCQSLQELANQMWAAYFGTGMTVCGNVKMSINGHLTTVSSLDVEAHDAVEKLIQTRYVEIQKGYSAANAGAMGLTDKKASIIAGLKPGKILALACSGTRIYPGNITRPSSHALTVGQDYDGKYYAYDSNDPQAGWVPVEVMPDSTIKYSALFKETATSIPVKTTQVYNKCQGLSEFISTIYSKTPKLPKIAQLVPNRSSCLATKAVTLTGVNFVNGAKVYLGGLEVKVTFKSAGQLSLVLPKAFAGMSNIVVINPDGTRSNNMGYFCDGGNTKLPVPITTTPPNNPVYNIVKTPTATSTGTGSGTSASSQNTAAVTPSAGLSALTGMLGGICGYAIDPAGNQVMVCTNN
jgi:hypothetical protein